MAALSRHECLSAFVTGVAAAEGTWAAHLTDLAAARRPVLRNRVVRGVAPTRLKSLAPVELGAVSFLPWPADTIVV